MPFPALQRPKEAERRKFTDLFILDYISHRTISLLYRRRRRRLTAGFSVTTLGFFSGQDELLC